MKRIIVVAVALVALAVVSNAYSAKVTIKNEGKKASAALQKEEAAENVNKIDANGLEARTTDADNEVGAP